MAELPTDFDWLKGFILSTAESVPEVIGVTPSTETLNWRQDNPVSGTISEFAGMATPYFGWLGAAMKVPRAAKAIAKIGDVINKPIGTAIKKELAIFAPFEAGRVGLSQAVGDNPFSEEISNSIVNLALGGGVAGFVGGVAAAGVREPAVRTIFPGLDVGAPKPLQARKMKEVLDSGVVRPEWLPRANREYNTTLREARQEVLPENYKYVQPLAPTVSKTKGKDIDQTLNRLFKPTNLPKGKTLQVRAFTRAADNNFDTADEWLAEAEFIGLDKDTWGKGQYFRSISFNPEKTANTAKHIDNVITKNFEEVGGNWYMTREADDGMFVMAKKYVGDAGKATPVDKWLLFKTDQPGNFLPESQRWADAMVNMQKWVAEPPLTDGGLIHTATKNYMQEIPFRNYQGVLSHSKLAQMAIDRLGPIGEGEFITRMREQLRSVLAPRNRQFVKEPRANYLSSVSKVAFDGAETTINELMNGVMKIDPGKQVFYTHFTRGAGSLGVTPARPTTMNIPEEEFAELFEKFIRPKVPLEEAEKAFVAGDISQGQLEVLKSYKAINDLTTVNINKAEVTAGKRPTDWKEGHYGWSHGWEGDTRIRIVDEKGVLKHLVGGPNKSAAQKAAIEYLKDHKEFKLGATYSRSQMIDDMSVGKEVPEPLVRNEILSPSWKLESAEVGGYKWWNKTPTREEFLEDLENNLRSRWKYQANLTVNELATPHMEALKRESPAAYKQLMQRMNADAGIQGEWGRRINRAVDSVLAPVIGNESATKIVSVTNTAMLNFHLGAMNLSYPAMNLTTFITNTLPEVAMVLNGLPDRLAPYYSVFLAGGTRGPVGAMGVLQPLKLAGRAIKEMMRPSEDVAEALSWAFNNRTLDPRMVEGYVGESTVRAKEIVPAVKGLIAGKGVPESFGFTRWLQGLSEWLPANSERMSRTHTFVMGYITARDLLRKNGRVLDKAAQFQFAKEFTDKTMYLYSAADKPRILTSPVGTGLGLFKNFMFNYIASMGQYTKEAFLKGNVAPLAWQTMGTFSLGGLASTPIYHAADLFSQAFTGNDSLSTIYEELGDEDGWFNPADGIMYGLPAMLSGISFHSQVSAPGANPARDAVSLFNSVIWDRMKATQAAMGGAWDHWQVTGNHPGSDANVRLAMAKAFLPNTLYRVMSTETDGDILSGTTGYPMVKNVSAYERWLYRLKLNPVDVDKNLAVSNKLYSQREERKLAVQQLGEAFTNAQLKGDGAEMALIMRQAMVWGVDASSVLKSSMARMTKHQEDMITRGYKPQDIVKYRATLEDR